MKRILLILLLASLVLPAMSQNEKRAKERKHSTAISFLRNSAEKSVSEKKQSRFDIFEASSIMIRNNANADSMLLFSNDDKADGWQLYAKEIPTYYEGTNLIKELETWSADAWSKTYFPVSKQVASYSDNGKLFRLETHYWDDNNWVPQYAEESVTNDFDEEVYYAWYNFNHNTLEWEMVDGLRAVEEYNENNITEVRFWEYYDSWEEIWVPEFKEVYTLNENNVIIELTEYWYDDWDDMWEPEYMLVFDLDENETWASGYSFQWNWFEEEWFPALKYESMSWFDFELMKISGLISLVNPAIFDDWDKKTDDDIEWMNFLKLHAEYTTEGLLSLMINYMEYDYDEGIWIPATQMELDYDHFGNVIYETFSLYYDEWILFFGYRMDMEYNEDQSVKAYDISLAFDNWKNEFAPVYRYEYYYAEETTGIPSFAKAEEMLVYPNPATSSLNLMWSGNDQMIDIDIIGLDGKIVERFEKYPVMTGQPVSLDISHLYNGVYIIRCQGKQASQLARFVKR